MRWQTHKELSRADIDLMVGSTTLTKMMRNKLIIKFTNVESIISYKKMGLQDCTGLYHIRKIQPDGMVLEIMFELKKDSIRVQEQLSICKISMD
jgi:hypothetical protein